MSRSFAPVTRVAWPDPIFSTNTLRRFSQGCINARYSLFGESEYPTLGGFRKKSFIGMMGASASLVWVLFCAKAEIGKTSKSCTSSTKALIFIEILQSVEEIGGGFDCITVEAVKGCGNADIVFITCLRDTQPTPAIHPSCVPRTGRPELAGSVVVFIETQPVCGCNWGGHRGPPLQLH